MAAVHAPQVEDNARDENVQYFFRTYGGMPAYCFQSVTNLRSHPCMSILKWSKMQPLVFVEDSACVVVQVCEADHKTMNMAVYDNVDGVYEIAPAAAATWNAHVPRFCNLKHSPNQPNAWKKTELFVYTVNRKLAVFEDDGISVTLNMSSLHENIAKLEKGLVGKLQGKLIGKRWSYILLIGLLKWKWSHIGEFQLLMDSHDYFIYLFSNVEARDAILMGGPWSVAGHIIGMERWTPSFSPQSMTEVHESWCHVNRRRNRKQKNFSNDSPKDKKESSSSLQITHTNRYIGEPSMQAAPTMDIVLSNLQLKFPIETFHRDPDDLGSSQTMLVDRPITEDDFTIVWMISVI
ncbi:hypothetical protein M5K25_013363 [Dendrobium thyrsiflorum]|uniref:DUF4283 domain-containing protein n=1 Tax=Dendrobium thyrsiflorum TaxID=117978 RepID=A0ABD0V067_DENTH